MHALFLLQHHKVLILIYLFIVPSLEERGIQNFFYFCLGDKNR